MTTITDPERVIRNAVANMPPEQFTAYESAIRGTDYYQLPEADQQNFVYALRAINERRANERSLNVTIADSAGFSIPWPYLLGGAVLLLLLARD